jgi:hypothetical protein
MPLVVKFLFPCLYGLFDSSSKAEMQRIRAEGVECRGVVAPLAVRALQTKRKWQGARAPRKSNNHRASRSVRGRGCGRGSAEAKTDMVLLDAEAGAFGELPPLVKQSFKEGR